MTSPRRPSGGLAGLALLAVFLLGAQAACAPAGGAATATASALRVTGSTTVNPVVARAAEALAAERGRRIVVDTQGGSSGGLAALAEGRADVAMTSRPVTDEDRRRFPGVDFRSFEIGVDAVALVVSRDVWDGGVRSLGRADLRAIYEQRITDWRAVGGPDRRIAFFDKEPGRGTWEVFARWLYGDPGRVPPVDHLEVGSNEEARTKVASTRGAVTQLSAAWADGETTFALALETPTGRVAPTAAHIADGSYPLARPLLLVTDGPPSPTARELIDFVRSARGRELVAEAGFLPPMPPMPPMPPAPPAGLEEAPAP